MVLILVLLKHPIIKLLSFLALSISSYVLGPFGLGLGHGPIWPLTFLAKLALHNIPPLYPPDTPLLVAVACRR